MDDYKSNRFQDKEIYRELFYYLRLESNPIQFKLNSQIQFSKSWIFIISL